MEDVKGNESSVVRLAWLKQVAGSAPAARNRTAPPYRGPVRSGILTAVHVFTGVAC